MKKKLLMTVAVFILTMCSVMTAFAQPSVTVGTVVDIDKVVDKDGEEVANIVLQEVKGEELKKVQDIVKPDNLKTVLPTTEAKQDWKVFATEAIVVNEKGEEINWEDVKEQFPVEITFSVPGVTTNSTIRVLHYYEGEWHVETITGNAKDVVKAKFTHLTGPIVILVHKEFSPTTGENNAVWYAGMIAVVALAGTMMLKKREN